MNGIGASLELFDPLVEAVDPTTGFIQFDVPGVGHSEAPARPYHLTGLARLVGRMVTRLGYDQVDVMGISWGGLLAQHFAGRYPRRCRRLVLVSTAPCTGAVPGSLLLVKEMLSRRRYVDSEYAMAVAPILYGGSLRNDPSLVRVLHAGVPATTRGYAYQLIAAVLAFGPPIIPRILQPTLILAGDDDPIIPLVNARVLRAALPNARLRIFDDGHLGILTRSPELALEVERFLDRADTARHGHIESALYLATVTARQAVRLTASLIGRADPTGAVGKTAIVRAAEELPLAPDR
jgi:poly(3-hydroxyalkanoate) depolymerase